MERDGRNRRLELMDAAMQIVAESGFSSLTMKKVTVRANVSEALVYKHFETKENLLGRCFDYVQQQMLTLFAQMPAPEVTSREALWREIRQMWMTYFDFLVSNTYRTVFYFGYRDFVHAERSRVGTGAEQQTWFAGVETMFGALAREFQTYEQTAPDYFWTYILDTTGLFAKRIIRGQLPDTPEGRENVWQLISGGVLGLLPTETP